MEEPIRMEVRMDTSSARSIDVESSSYRGIQESKDAVELELDKVLSEPGDFQSIEKKVTPKTLTSCTTNALFKSFEVNKILKDLVKSAVNPETDEIETLSKSVDGFTCALVDPLRSDSDTRNTFKSCFDSVVDKAIDTEQKEFISHPVVYNLLNSRWYRSFTSVRKKPWTSASRWGYLFVNLLPVLDMFFCPFLLALFFVVHLINESLIKSRETELFFVVTLNKNAACAEKAFALIQKTISYIIHKYGYRSANYSVILRDEDNATSTINLKEVYSSVSSLENRVEALKQPNASPRLYEDLCAARDAFKSTNVRIKAKKILVVFTNDKLSKVCAEHRDLNPVLREITELGVRVIPVGIGEEAKLSELGKIASKTTTALHFGEYEAPKTLGKAIIQGVEGKDIFDLYLDYFTTPCFVFVRDTLSYITILVLHFAFCQSPPTIVFSPLEWVIFILFLGRILIEVDQFMGAKTTDRKAAKQRLHQGSSYVNVVFSPHDESQAVMKKSEENVVIKNFSNYFRDRWNMLDFIILVIYIPTFTMRMFTWATSTSVAYNRTLAVAGYLHGLIAMILTLRVFGHVLECMRGLGAIQIALFFIIWDVLAIFWHFFATILAFSLAITKIYVVEKSYASNDTSGGSLFKECEDVGLICWWNIAKHLAWSLLGITAYDTLESIDTPSTTLTFLLYILFLIMGVILLVNMMVALLSNTYQRVQDNSLKEWSFKKAITIRTYSSYHPVPVPFNLVSIPIMGIWRLCQCCVSEKNQLDESGRKIALDNLTKKLEKTYFATYGYSFPLTDESKMDQLLRETKGSRRMANQIVERVFRQQGCKQDKYMTGAHAWESLGIGIKGCLLTYEGPDFCHVCKEKEKEHQTQPPHGARYLMPFTPETPRIEVLIEDSGERRILAVGAVFEGYDCHSKPGWKEGTVGYHVDDGKIFEPGCNDQGKEVEDAMAYRGDLIACEVDFNGATNETLPVLFFLNGRKVADALMKRKTGETNPFPFISMGYEGIRVLAQMCPASDSGMPLVYHAYPDQHLAKYDGIEQDLIHKLREDMEKMERERKVQAMEQWKMLTEIRNLVMLSMPERKTTERASNDDVVGSENRVTRISVTVKRPHSSVIS